jgi:hypothetical protein
MYAVVINENKVEQWWFDQSSTYEKYLDGDWHHFSFFQTGEKETDKGLVVDGLALNGTFGTDHFFKCDSRFFNLFNLTHAMVGGTTLAGQYYTGRSKLQVDNFGFIVGETMTDNLLTEMGANNGTSAMQNFTGQMLDNNQPVAFCGWNEEKGAYLLQMEEGMGMHGFAADEHGRNKLYGLILNGTRVETSTKEPLIVVEQGGFTSGQISVDEPALSQVSFSTEKDQPMARLTAGWMNNTSTLLSEWFSLIKFK